MMRTMLLAIACVLITAAPATAKKRHAAPHKKAHAVAKKQHKAPKALVRFQPSPPPTRVASAEQRPAPAPVVSTPAPTPTPAPSPPVEHGPLGPQAGDDEVPGSRMKR